MTKKGKITTGIVAGVVVLGGIGMLTDKDTPNSLLENETSTSAIIEEVTEKTTTTIKEIETTVEETTVVITTVEETTTTAKEVTATEAVTTTEATTTTVATTIQATATQNVTQTTATVTTEKKQVVYIAASGNGKKYHASKTCSGMDGNVIEMSREEAEAAGYTPCQKNSCYK